jgi:hypothetical protein
LSTKYKIDESDSESLSSSFESEDDDDAQQTLKPLVDDENNDNENENNNDNVVVDDGDSKPIKPIQSIDSVSNIRASLGKALKPGLFIIQTFLIFSFNFSLSKIGSYGALLSENRREFYVCDLALQLSGIVTVPIHVSC